MPNTYIKSVYHMKHIVRPTNLDLPKIGALHRAGWDNEKIGEEFGVPAKIIELHMEEAKKALEECDRKLKEVSYE